MNQTMFQLQDSPTAQHGQPLMSMRLLKAVDQVGEDAPWIFRGIASDESRDIEGDRILRKCLDVSYAAQRGYVNWEHKTDPAYQIGFLTKCEILNDDRIEELSKSGIPNLQKSATVYVEGELYKHVKQAQDTYSLLKSVPDGAVGPGLSLDGIIARDQKSQGVVRAFVHGVAISHRPMHPATVAHLKKSLAAYQAMTDSDGPFPADLPAEIAAAVVSQLRKANSERGLSNDEAVLFVLRNRPTWSYDLASKLVKYTRQVATGA